jgi:lysophospholipase L1-like esterase
MFDRSRHPLTSLFCIPTLLIVLSVPLAADGPAPPPAARFRFADGDRVVLIGNTLVERAQRFGHLETSLLARLAPLKLTFRNLGWSGDTVFAESRGLFDTPAKGYQRLLEHVARLKPTVLILGYGSNESFDGPEALPRFLKQYSKLIADLRSRSAPSTRVVILTIPPQQRPGLGRVNTDRLGVVVNGVIAPAVPSFARSRLASPVARNRQIREYNAALAKFARTNRHSLFDLNTPFLGSLRPSFVAEPTQFTVDGRALNSIGYELLATGILDQLHGLGPLTVQLKDKQPPRVIGPLATSRATYRDGRLELTVRPGRFVLRVLGLPRGRYRVTIDQHDFGKFSANYLAAGIAEAVTGPPAGFETLRKAVIAKNRLYFHRWRPQNTTYLFGFRKHEQGNNAKEVAQFEKLVTAAEATIDRLKNRVLHRITIKPAR